MEGKIFSIEEFSTFDGPGIRTTVFLKGCPLRCTWCHNPEGQRFETEYMRNDNVCVKCGNCLQYAETNDGVIRLSKKSAENCSKHCIRRSGEEYTAKALAYKILKNERILTMNGGGVTFSGGEPLSQWKFIKECIANLKGLSVAIQTSGFADEETFLQAVSISDYILFDLKLWDAELHKQYCGQSNEVILNNYKLLSKSGKKFITRIPLIPQVTDTKTNLESIAKFVSECGVRNVEVLAYNRLAGSKYVSLLREDIPNYNIEKATSFDEIVRIFKQYGIKAIKM